MYPQELDLGRKYDVHVASIIRGTRRINIPGGENRIYPNDTLQVIGTDGQLAVFSAQVEKLCADVTEDDFIRQEMCLKQFVVEKDSPFCGVTIKESGIRKEFHCLVVGIESAGDNSLRAPDVNLPLGEGDILWIVGEKDDLAHLFEVHRVG